MLRCRRRIIGSRLNFGTVVSQGIKLTNYLLFVILCLVMGKINLRKIISMPRVEGVVDVHSDVSLCFHYRCASKGQDIYMIDLSHYWKMLTSSLDVQDGPKT